MQILRSDSQVRGALWRVARLPRSSSSASAELQREPCARREATENETRQLCLESASDDASTMGPRLTPRPRRPRRSRTLARPPSPQRVRTELSKSVDYLGLNMPPQDHRNAGFAERRLTLAVCDGCTELGPRRGPKTIDGHKRVAWPACHQSHLTVMWL